MEEKYWQTELKIRNFSLSKDTIKKGGKAIHRAKDACNTYNQKKFVTWKYKKFLQINKKVANTQSKSGQVLNRYFI